MAKLMLVTPRMAHVPLGGRALLSKLHEECLRAILGPELIVHELQAPTLGWPRRPSGAVLGYIDGVTPQSESQVVDRIQSEGINQVFLNGSNLGHLASYIRRHVPSAEILTFFHNVESRFFLGALRAKPTVHGLGVLMANYQAEKLAVKASNRCIVLNERDALLLERIYGRHPSDLVPMAIKDRLLSNKLDPCDMVQRDDYILFVGGAFYANIEGIRWFAKHVAPHVRLRTCVVGYGLEEYKSELEKSGNLHVIGAVNDLADWYRGAKVAIAPIFDGSGMKTKVAEALMFGKQIVGTREAFVGYEKLLPNAGWECNDAHAFIRTLTEIQTKSVPSFDPELRDAYERHYSVSALKASLSQLVC